MRVSIKESHSFRGGSVNILFEYPKEEPAFFWADDSFRLSGIRHIGLDMSLPDLYVDSSGKTPFYTLSGKCGSTVMFSKAYRKLEGRIAREQRKLSHMVKDSNNYGRQLTRIAKLHAKAKHERRDFLRQMAARLASSYDIISVEDLDMNAIKRSLKFGKSFSDNGWGMFVLFLEEACLKRGSVVIRVGKWFPSSKTCSSCGHVKHDLQLNERTYVCPKCGHVMGRDHQAAVNIDNEGLRIFTSYFNMSGAA